MGNEKREKIKEIVLRVLRQIENDNSINEKSDLEDDYRIDYYCRLGYHGRLKKELLKHGYILKNVSPPDIARYEEVSKLIVFIDQNTKN